MTWKSVAIRCTHSEVMLGRSHSLKKRQCREERWLKESHKLWGLYRVPKVERKVDLWALKSSETWNRAYKLRVGIRETSQEYYLTCWCSRCIPSAITYPQSTFFFPIYKFVYNRLKLTFLFDYYLYLWFIFLFNYAFYNFICWIHYLT